MANPKLDDDKKKKSFGSSVGKAAPRRTELEPNLFGGPVEFGTTGSGRQGTAFRPTQNGTGFPGFINTVANDATRDFFNFGQSVYNWAGGYPQAPAGGGAGDARVGRNPNQKLSSASRKMAPLNRGRAQAEGPEYTQAMSFADALAQAMGLLGQYGGDDGGYGYSDIPFVNYDPQRNEARGRASEADIRLGAMYDQLTKSIDADEAGIVQSYESAISNSNAAGDQGRANAQAAADAASSRNNDVLASLGIQDANAQIIGEGRDLNTQTANQQADMASNQAAVAQNLVQNQAASVQQNKSIANASTLEGNLQRARNSAQLNALLAQIDMEEQGQNTGIASQNQQAAMQAANANRSEKNGRLSSAMSFASQLFGANRDDIDRENAMLAEMSKAPKMSKQQNMMNALSALIADGTLPADMDFDQLVKAMGALK